MIKNICMSVLVLILINLFACRIYSSIARIFFKNKLSNQYSDYKKNRKKNPFGKLRQYLGSLYFFTIRLIGIIPSFAIRTFIYKYVFLMKIGKGTKIRGFVEFSAPWNIEIGQNSMIGQECKLDGRNGLYIGNNVNISDCTAIWTEQHDINDEHFACNDRGGKVIIEDRVWLGFRSIVLPKVQIKEGAVLASGAIATKDCEAFSLYAGIPAKKIKDRNIDINYNLDIDYMHFI